jgi:hypothetical protein
VDVQRSLVRQAHGIPFQDPLPCRAPRRVTRLVPCSEPDDHYKHKVVQHVPRTIPQGWGEHGSRAGAHPPVHQAPSRRSGHSSDSKCSASQMVLTCRPVSRRRFALPYSTRPMTQESAPVPWMHRPRVHACRKCVRARTQNESNVGCAL